MVMEMSPSRAEKAMACSPEHQREMFQVKGGGP
jgi:hypothetical protein